MGIDSLPDVELHKLVQLKNEDGDEIGAELLAEKATMILNSDIWPSYLGTARYIALAKVPSTHPLASDTRTIAILPAWSKVIENIILQRLNSHLYGTDGVILKNQVGFRPAQGTEVQINRILQMFE